MKHIRIFGIILLVAFLSLPLDVLACDNFKAKVDAARQAVKVAKKRYDGYNAVHTVNVTVTLGRVVSIRCQKPDVFVCVVLRLHAPYACVSERQQQ